MLWEKYLSDNKYEYMITLDEEYFYQDYCNETRKIGYSQPGKNISKNWLIMKVKP